MKINRSVLIVLPLFLIGISLLTWRLVSYGQQRTLEFQAIEIAEIIARQAASARSVYSRYVVRSLAGMALVPISNRTTKKALYRCLRSF